MNAIVVHRGETRPRLVDRPRPEPGDGEALVRILRVGIDGTDHEVLSGAHGGFPDGADEMVLGHEAVGVVADPNDTDLETGAVVVPTVRRPPDPEDPNEYFQRGEPDMAPAGEYLERGIEGADGFMAEYVTSPAEYLVEIPPELASWGFLVEPLSITEKAIEHAFASRSAFQWEPETLLVLGNGSLGLLSLAALTERFEDLYCLGRRARPDRRIDLLDRLGATSIDSRDTPVPEIPEGYEAPDLIIEATGYARHPFESIAALAPNGVAAILGIPGPSTIEIDGGALHREFVLHNKALVGSVNASVRHFESATESLSTVDEEFLEDLVTGIYDPTDVEAALETDDTTIKTAVEFGRYEER